MMTARAVSVYVAAALLVVLSAPLAQAAPRGAAYQPAGATATPRVEARWNYFRDYAQATELLEQLAAEFPDLCRLESIGRSWEGREMWILTITNAASGEDAAKPGFWIDGGIHAGELQGTDVVLYTAWYLLEMYEHNDFIRGLVDKRVFYLLPMLSPDSRDAHFHEPSDSGSPRSGQRPVDDDRDGLVNEDGPDDLDGDGHIARMRKRDENGRWKAHPEYPELMVRCELGEPGEFTMLWDEGLDNDGDGWINEDGDGYYDPNRDWAWHWQPRYVEWGSFRYPFSIAENRLAADFIMAHPNIIGGQSYHNTAGMLLRGPGDPDDRYAHGDVAIYDVIGGRGEELLPGYSYCVTSEALYPAYGLSKDWMYAMQGILSFTTELGTSFNYFRQKNTEGWFGSREEAQKFNDYLLFAGGMVEWHEYDHPTYGPIEIGGRKKTWGRQPASFLLEEECHRNMAFTLYHADQLPQVQVQAIEARKLDRELLEVTATIVNQRLVPTHLAIDLERRLTRPDLVSLEGEGFRVLAASHSDSQFFERPIEQRREPAVVRVPAIESMGTVYVRWLVQGYLPEAVSVDSVKGGRDRLELGDPG